MKVTVELIPDPDEGGYTARIADIPAYGEGDTPEAAIEDLKHALSGYIDIYGVEDAKSRINSPSERRQVELDFGKLASG